MQVETGAAEFFFFIPLTQESKPIMPALLQINFVCHAPATANTVVVLAGTIFLVFDGN